MKTLVNILKAILLWFTVGYSVLCVASLDYVLTLSHSATIIMVGIVQLTVLYVLCANFISNDDMRKLSGYDMFERYILNRFKY